MDFHSALIGKAAYHFRVVDSHAFACAWAKLGKDVEGLPYSLDSAIEWWRRTGEILNGVEVTVEEAGDE